MIEEQSNRGHYAITDRNHHCRDGRLAPRSSRASRGSKHRFSAAPGVYAVTVGNAFPGGGLLVAEANFKIPDVSDRGP
jgi:hypothetical protein